MPVHTIFELYTTCLHEKQIVNFLNNNIALTNKEKREANGIGNTFIKKVESINLENCFSK